jgi:desulfoferrodoxin (superoxide reductase-like protein)
MREKEGGKTLLQVEVRHNSPSMSHYVDIIEFDINGEVHRATDLRPQSDRVFTYTYELGDVEASNIKVRAHCNFHGWSSWTFEEKEEEGEGGGIPGFPYESVLLGVLLGGLILWTLQRKR